MCEYSKGSGRLRLPDTFIMYRYRFIYQLWYSNIRHFIVQESFKFQWWNFFNEAMFVDIDENESVLGFH